MLSVSGGNESTASDGGHKGSSYWALPVSWESVSTEERMRSSLVDARKGIWSHKNVTSITSSL